MNKRISYIFLFLVIVVASFPATIAQETAPSNSEGCPNPLISLKSTGLSKTATSLCLSDDCCLPCPIANNFYEENQIDMIFHILSAVRVISFISILIIVTSYIVLPNKREHSAITVLCFNVSLLIFLGVTFFYIGSAKKIQCADLVSQATIRNNTLCGIQGIILILSTFLLVLWCFLLILQLHFQTVWNSDIIQRYHVIAQTLVILIAVTFTILPAVMGKISFDLGAVCLVSSDFGKELFWYPLAGLVIPGFLLHIWTFIHVGKSQCSMDYYDDDSTWLTEDTKSSRPLANVTGQEIVKAIKIQWRSSILALIFLVTFMIYWTYVVVELDKIVPKNFLTKPWFLEWSQCILKNGMASVNAQNECSVYTKDHIPSIAYMISAELSTAMLGISMFIVFGTSVDLWSEWKSYFTKKFGGVSSRSSDSQVSFA